VEDCGILLMKLKKGSGILDDSELAFTSAIKLRELVATKQISPVEVTENALRRVDRLNPKLNAFLTVAADRALQDAKRAEEDVIKKETLGPLHGVPTSIKDLLETEGIRTTKGSHIFRNRVPSKNDFLVDRIRNAGAIILGKTNTPEFGHGGGVTENRLADFCRNPWNPEMVSGASSGGAAVSVATGINPISHGTDGGGSIRVPASFCGVFGIMGTMGRVPRRNTGLISSNPVWFSQDGPLSRTVSDAALYLRIMSGPHSEATGKGSLPEPAEGFLADISGSIKGLRIGWSPNLGSIPVEKAVAAICEKAVQRFETLGATVEDSGFIIDIEEVSETFGTLTATQDYINYGYLLAEHGEEMVSYVKQAIVTGKNTSAEVYALALARMERLRKYVRESFSRYDLLITPTLAVAPFPCGYRPEVIDGVKVPKMSGFYSMLYPFNMTGNPSASIPCGFTIDNLPVGLHIVGRKLDELTIINASLAFEEAYPWAHLRPMAS